MLITKTMLLLGLTALVGFAGRAAAAPAIQPVAHVDLPRYMGRWYVIALIPTRAERHAYNAVETYGMNPDGSVCTWYRLRAGSEAAPVKLIHSTAVVVPGSGGGEWSVHLYWLLRLQYKIGWLGPAYDQVMVVRDKRDYLWYMARTPQVSEADYQAMLERAKAMGYDVSRIIRVPQHWPETGAGRDTFTGNCP